MSTCATQPILNKLNPIGGRLFSETLDQAIKQAYNGKGINTIDELSVSKAGEITLKAFLGEDTELTDLSELATSIYEKALTARTEYQGVNSLIDLVNNYASNVPAELRFDYNVYKNLPGPEKYSIGKQLQTALTQGRIKFNDDSLYREFVAFVFKTNQLSGRKWFANLSDYTQHKGQKTVREVLDEFLSYSKEQGVLKHADSEFTKTRMIDVLKTKLEGFRVTIKEDAEEKDEEGGLKQEANTQSASSYAGSQVKLYLSSIRKANGQYYSAEEITAKLINNFSNLTDQEVLDKIKQAGENSYLRQIYNDLFADYQLSDVVPETDLAALEIINEKERLKLRLAFQAFIQKVSTEPLATVERGGKILMTNKVIENQTFNYRKQIQEGIKSNDRFKIDNPFFVAGDRGISNFVSGNAKEIQTAAEYLSNLAASPTEDISQEYSDILYKTGIIPGIFKSIDAFALYHTMLYNYRESDTDQPKNLQEFNILLSKVVDALRSVAADKVSKEQAYNIFAAQENQTVGANNVPLLKLASDAYDNLINFVLTTSDETVRTYMYFKDNGSKVYSNSLQTTVHRLIHNYKRAKRVADANYVTGQAVQEVNPLPYFIESQRRVMSALNSLEVAEFVQHERENTTGAKDLVFGSQTKNDHFKSIVQSLSRGYVPFARAAERGIQRMLKADLTDATESSVMNELANKLVYEATTAVYNRIQLQRTPQLFDGLAYKTESTKLRQFRDVISEDFLTNVFNQITKTEDYNNLTDRDLVNRIQRKVTSILNLNTDKLGYAVITTSNELFNPIKAAFYDVNVLQFQKYLTENYDDVFVNGIASSDRIQDVFGHQMAKALKTVGDVVVEGFRPVTVTEFAQKLAAMHVEGQLMQFSLVFGDVGIISPANFNKRATLYQSTKQANLVTVETAEAIDKLYPRVDGRNRQHLAEVFGDIVVATVVLEEVQIEPQQFIKKYLRDYYERTYEPLLREGKITEAEFNKKVEDGVNTKIDSADGASFVSLDHLRDYFLQNEATQWTSQHDMLFNYEAQKLLLSYIIHNVTYEQFGIPGKTGPIMTIDRFNEIFSQHLAEPLDEDNPNSIINFVPQNYKTKIAPEYLDVSLGITKPQGASPILGRQVGENVFIEPFKVNSLNANIKTAASFRGAGLVEVEQIVYSGPIASLVGKTITVPKKDSTNYMMQAYMFAGQIDYLSMPSADKTSKASFNDTVKITTSGFKVSDKPNYVVQYVSGLGYGKQVDTATEEKNKVTLSTQLRRLLAHNMMHAISLTYGDNVELAEQKAEQLRNAVETIHKNLNAMSLNQFVDNLTSVGFEFVNDNGEVKFVFDEVGITSSINSEETKQKQEELLDRLLSNYDGRAMNLAVKESLEALRDLIPKGLMKFDLTLAKDDIENSLATSVKRANNIKVYGEAYIQDTGVGYDTDFRMYQLNQNGTEILRAEVAVPLPRKLVSFVNKRYKAKTFEERLQLFNNDIEQFNKTGKGLPDSFKYVLNFLANRTPSQSAASIEAFNIKKFLVPWAGPRIVLPLEFPLKSGSDFDVDKLSSYLNYFTFNEKGEPVVNVADNSTPETAASQIAEFYFNDVNRLNKDSVKESIVSKLRAIYNTYSNLTDEFLNKEQELDKILDNVIKLREDIDEAAADKYINNYIKLYKEIQKQMSAVEREIMNGRGTTVAKRESIKEAEIKLFNKLWAETFEEPAVSYDVFLEDVKYYSTYNEAQAKSVRSSLYNYIKNVIVDANAKGIQGADLLTPVYLQSNKFVNDYGKVYTMPENIGLIYSPIGAPYLKTLASEILDTPKDAKTYNSLFTLEHELNTFSSFMGGDKSIGQSAIANALHSVAQLYPIKLRNERAIATGTKFEKTSPVFAIGYLYDGIGRLKSDTYNEQITGYVDVARDPFIMRLLVQLRTYNIFHFMHEVYGIPMDRITMFLAMPGVYQRIANIQNDEFIHSYGSERNPPRVLEVISRISKIRELMPSTDVIDQYEISDRLLNKFYWKNLDGKGKTITPDYMLELDEAELKQLFLDNGITKQDLDALENLNVVFDSVKEHAKELSALKQYQRPDSSFAQRSISVRLKLMAAQQTLASKMFDSDDITRYIENTYLAQQLKNQFALVESQFNKLGFNRQGVFTPLFFMEKSGIVSNIVMPFLYHAATVNESERVLDNKLRRLNDTILTALLTSSLDLKDRYSELLKSDDIKEAFEYALSLDVMQQPQNAKLKYFLSRFIANSKYLTRGRGESEPSDQINAVNVLNEKASIEEQYALRDGFMMLDSGPLSDDPTIEKINQNLVDLMMLQFGLVSGPNPWKTTIPQAAVADLIEEFADKFDEDLNTIDVLGSLMVQVAQTNNQYNDHTGDADLLISSFKGVKTSKAGEAPKQEYIKMDSRINDAEGYFTIPLSSLADDNIRDGVVKFLEQLIAMPLIRTQTKRGDLIQHPIVLARKATKNNDNFVIHFERLHSLNKLYNISGEYEAVSNIPKHGFKSNIVDNNIDRADKDFELLPTDPKTITEIRSNLQEALIDVAAVNSSVNVRTSVPFTMEVREELRGTQPTSGVEITKSNYTRENVQNNPDTAYVFTENTHSITAFPNRAGGGSAVIRGLDNAFAIVTKKKYDYNTRENVDYSDTPENFKEFVDVNTRLINELKNSGKSKIVFPQGFATDKAKMPTRFAEWLQKALLDNFGLVTELNSTKTGLISKSISQPTQAVRGTEFPKLLMQVRQELRPTATTITAKATNVGDIFYDPAGNLVQRITLEEYQKYSKMPESVSGVKVKILKEVAEVAIPNADPKISPTTEKKLVNVEGIKVNTIFENALVKPESATTTTKPVANIPQNKVSGVESYGSLVTANDEVIKVLGVRARSIDMIERGFRTRTTRSADEMATYNVKVGDIIKHFGTSADGTIKNIYARVTAIHPKGTPGWKGTWSKEGWRKEDINVIDRFKDGAAAIEFEVINADPLNGYNTNFEC